MTADRAIELAIAALETKQRWYDSRPRSQRSAARRRNERETDEAIEVLRAVRRTIK